MTPPRLFVYGTLQDEALVARLIGRRLPSWPAVLSGYHRVFDRSIGYPVIHPLEGGSVDGRVLEGVDAAALAEFDAYEGSQYRRVVVPVRTGDGRTVDAHAYVPVS